MSYLILIVSKSGGGKSEVFTYLHQTYQDFFPMLSYTSRPKRHKDEGGYFFKEKQYFKDYAHEFVELATYPPHSNPDEEHVHYYGKHQSQFDGKNYVMCVDEVGVLTLKQLEEEGKLFGYKLVTLFIDIDEAIRLERTDHDQARIARDAKRKFLPLDFYDFVINNNGTKEELFLQVDDIITQLQKE